MEEHDYRIALGYLNRARSSVVDADVLAARMPDAKVSSLDSPDDCVNSLLTGAVNAVVIPSTSLETFREQYRIEDMKTAELPQTLGLSAYVAKGNASCSPC